MAGLLRLAMDSQHGDKLAAGFSNSDFLCDFREIMDVDAIVIEGGSKDSRDNFGQDSGPRQHGEDFPLGAFKTGSR